MSQNRLHVTWEMFEEHPFLFYTGCPWNEKDFDPKYY